MNKCAVVPYEQKYNFKHFGVIDTHFNLVYDKPIEETVKIFEDIIEYFGLEGIVLQAVHHLEGGDPANNAKALYCKSIMNETYEDRKVYAYGNLYHYFDGRDTAEGYLHQIQLMDRLGFDGIKILDGKPGHRKKLGRPLDDPIFDGFYNYAEKKKIPIKMHVGDPSAHWDITKISEYALKMGWFCDESFPTLQQLRDEVDGILSKFPKLHLDLAHFYFFENDLEACEALLESWENVSFDLCPGNWFLWAAKQPDKWRKFFQKYANRLYFGTDTYNFPYKKDKQDYEKNCYRIWLTRNLLEGTEAFKDANYGELKPLNLEDSTLQKIYHNNCVELMGEPKTINRSLAAFYTADVLTKMEHGFVATNSEERDIHEKDNLRKVYQYFYGRSTCE